MPPGDALIATLVASLRSLLSHVPHGLQRQARLRVDAMLSRQARNELIQRSAISKHNNAVPSQAERDPEKQRSDDGDRKDRHVYFRRSSRRRSATTSLMLSM